ncbi:hypothetical protein [Ornithinibacillus scapharcae]|uniref:hypothetical protein n=1 Tax=Ornithinibacillus scapharcae TaxID=1147159 RepID=UPI000225C01C|nr:hypothetical protein [Ornithinibacillus scapharcae]
MIRFLKLTNFELNRFFKIYLSLIGITFVMQILAVVIASRNYMNEVKEQLANGNTMEYVLNNSGMFSLNNVTRGMLFTAPVALCIVTLLIYVFFIWYRDWLGKNTFAYRLLMLPISRIKVYFAKATAIFLMVLGLVSLQIVFLLIQKEIMVQMVPDVFRIDQNLHEIIFGFDYMRVIFPLSFMEFLIHYGIGFMAVLVVFTAILLERSFRWKGILLGLAYVGAAVLVFISPVLLQISILEEFFYPTELFILTVITGLVVTAGSIWMSHYLLNKKIRV